MPDNQLKYKAGKLSFLLVCLFLCAGCGREKAVFYAGESSQQLLFVEKTTQEDVVISMEAEVSKSAEEEAASQKLININTAEIEELMQLPGIGQTRAAAIVEYRQQTGNFEKIEDIMNVKGIKTGIFSKINSLICVK